MYVWVGGLGGHSVQCDVHVLSVKSHQTARSSSGQVIYTLAEVPSQLVTSSAELHPADDLKTQTQIHSTEAPQDHGSGLSHIVS